jgi:hypothetical protein
VQPLIHLLVIASFSLLVGVWWSRAARGVWAPTTFFGFFTIVFGMPVYLLALQGNDYHGEAFAEDITEGGLMLALGMYPAAMLAMLVESYAGNPRQCFRLSDQTDRMTKRAELILGVVVLMLLVLWIFGTPRLGMLKGLIRGLSLGDPAELNHMRRTEYASGLFNQKIFTWLRFSLGPILSLAMNEALRFRVKAPIRWIICYAVYFLFSAAFHKSTWVLGFGFIALNEFFAMRRGFVPSRLIAVAMIATSSSAGGLMAIAYALQYRANTTLTFFDHLRQGFTRVFGCTNDGIFNFTYVFPDRVPYMPYATYLGPFAPVAEESPERLAALALGADSTIQPGLLGSLYAGGGVLCVPAYIVIVVAMGFAANLIVAQIADRTLYRIFAPPVVVAMMWTLHNPLFPAVFGSGLFMACVFAIAIGQWAAIHQTRERMRATEHKNRGEDVAMDGSGASLLAAGMDEYQ